MTQLAIEQQPRRTRGPHSRECDALVIGGGLKGLITTYILTNAGYRTVLLESEHELGGKSGSFKTARGQIFDYGYHTLDYNRSTFTTKFFETMLDGRCRKFLLHRAIVLRNELIPYNAPIGQWPTSLRDLSNGATFVDAAPVDRPGREQLFSAYGRSLTDFIFDEALRSYACSRWALDHGRPEHELSPRIYPWFFPQAEKTHHRAPEWYRYHDRVRAAGRQYVLYPADGGQGSLVDAIRSRMNNDYVDIRTGASGIEFDVDLDLRSILRTRIDGEAYTSPRVFWCGSLGHVCRLFDVRLPGGVGQQFVLGSFEFESPVDSAFHEILVGDPNHLVDRISFPGRIRGATDNLVQLEFAFPKDEYELGDEQWHARWKKSLVVLGLVDESNPVLDFDFKTYPLGIVATQDLVELVHDCEQALRHPDSNIVYPFFGAGPENMNRLIPSVFRNVYASITC